MVGTLENPTVEINGIKRKELAKRLKQMRVNNSKQVAKYEIVLKKLKAQLELSDELGLTEFFKENHVSSIVGQVLKDGGIIRKTGFKNYEWVPPIEPNRYMAQELISRMRKNAKKSSIELVDAAKEREVIEQQMEEIKNRYDSVEAGKSTHSSNDNLTATDTKTTDVAEKSTDDDDVMHFEVEGETVMLPEVVGQNPEMEQIIRDFVERIKSKDESTEPKKKVTTVRIPFLWGLFSFKYQKTVENE